MIDYNVEYKIVRANRKSVCITVSPDNVITVRCPKNYSENKIREFLQSKSEWINSVVKRNSSIMSDNDGIFDYKQIYICGKKLPLIISDKDEISSNAVYVKDINHIKKLFICTFKEEFLNYAFTVSKEIGIEPADFDLKAYKSKWGCCDRSGKITLNYLLIMLPEDLQRYVIIHELCHTIYFNHSKHFWRMVAAYEPEYKSKRNRLKTFNFITNLY